MRTILFFAFLFILTGFFWLWSAESWRIGCLIAPFLLVFWAVLFAGIVESKKE